MSEKQEAIRREYDASAADYDEDWSYYVKATTTETVQRMDLSGDQTVLDVGCGTGYLLKFLRSAGFSGDCYGLDLSPEMLKVAAHRLGADASLAASQAESLPIRSGSLDVVVTGNAFHFFLDPAAFLREVKRILKPKGKVYITDWNDEYWACWCCDYYLSATDPAHTTIYSPSAIKSLLRSAGFDVTRLDTYKIDWLWGLMTIEARPE